MTDLVLPLCSITSTKRRRFFWAVWTSGPPTYAPFKKPDVSGGGAPSHDAALAEAERKVGSSVVLVDPLWARACIRLMRGEPLWPSKASRAPQAAAQVDRKKSAGDGSETNESVWAALGVDRDVTPEDLKAAYRRRVLETHPDQGGDAEALRKVVRAYMEASRRVRRPRPRTAR